MRGGVPCGGRPDSPRGRTAILVGGPPEEHGAARRPHRETPHVGPNGDTKQRRGGTATRRHDIRFTPAGDGPRRSHDAEDGHLP
jgi:hypothetical protein